MGQNQFRKLKRDSNQNLWNTNSRFIIWGVKYKHSGLSQNMTREYTYEEALAIAEKRKEYCRKILRDLQGTDILIPQGLQWEESEKGCRV